MYNRISCYDYAQYFRTSMNLIHNPAIMTLLVAAFSLFAPKILSEVKVDAGEFIHGGYVMVVVC